MEKIDMGQTSLSNKNQSPNLSFQILWNNRSDILLISAFVIITALYISLMIKDTFPFVCLILVALTLALHWFFYGHQRPVTPMTVPVFGLLCLLPLSFYISIDRDLSLPKILGLVLCIFLVYIIVHWVHNFQRLQLTIPLLLLLVSFLIILGFLGMVWPQTNNAFLIQIYSYLSRFSLPEMNQINQDGINANTTAGALTFFFPLLLSLLLDGGAYQKASGGRKINKLGIFYKIILLVLLLLVCLLLFLSQSRSAWLGCAIGLLVLGFWKDRRFLWVLPFLLIGLLIAQKVLGVENIQKVFLILEAGGDASVTGRLDVWRNALYIIRDFSFTGVGIGTFSLPFNGFYAYVNDTIQGVRYFHAHNNLLSVAVDLGIPALVLYVSLLTSFFSMAIHAYKTAQPILKVLIIGLGCGMIAHQVFGVFDAFSLGKKLGVFMWIYFGLMTAIYIYNGKHQRNGAFSPEIPDLINDQVRKFRFMDHIKHISMGAFIWLVFSMIAIAFVNLNFIITLCLVIGVGILLGVLLVKQFSETSMMPSDMK